MLKGPLGRFLEPLQDNKSNHQEIGSAFGPSPTELVLPVVGALVGFWSEPDVCRACCERD